MACCRLVSCPPDAPRARRPLTPPGTRPARLPGRSLPILSDQRARLRQRELSAVCPTSTTRCMSESPDPHTCSAMVSQTRHLAEHPGGGQAISAGWIDDVQPQEHLASSGSERHPAVGRPAHGDPTRAPQHPRVDLEGFSSLTLGASAPTAPRQHGRPGGSAASPAIRSPDAPAGDEGSLPRPRTPHRRPAPHPG